MLLICKDCRHCVPAQYWTELKDAEKALYHARCWATAKPNLVNGEYEPEFHCSTARQSERLCGEEGKWFELNEPHEVYEQVPNQTEETV